MLFLLGLLAVGQSAKVLFSPSTLEPVHSYTMAHLANELASRGHQVTWFEYGPYPSETTLSKSISKKFLPTPFGDQKLTDLYIHRNHSIYDEVWYPDFDHPNEQTTGWLAGTRLCDRMLVRHKKTFDALVEEEFDTVVVDDLYNPCGLLLAGLKGSVYVYWSMTGLRPESAWANQSPNPPSYLPTPGTKLTDELTFWQRSYNLAAYLKELYIHQHLIHNRIDAVFQKHYPGTPSAFFLERNASINFVNTPPIFDFARPFMPRVNFVGGLHCHNATQLPEDYSKFVEGADDENGFVVVSSGYSVQWSRAHSYMVKAFVNAMTANPKTRFIWQTDGRPEVPSNVKTHHRIPLQDLLGHKKCRAHVTLGGLNSVIESVWHGVPVVGVPLTARHYDNLLRLTARGAGVMVTKEQIARRDDALTKAFEEIKDKKYKGEMLVFQDMVRDVPYTELNHAAFWVEFIERHQEVPHARSGADKLNVFQYFLVDVLLFMMSVSFVAIAVFVFTLKTIWRILKFLVSLVFKRGQTAPKPAVTKAKKRN